MSEGGRRCGRMAEKSAGEIICEIVITPASSLMGTPPLCLSSSNV